MADGALAPNDSARKVLNVVKFKAHMQQHNIVIQRTPPEAGMDRPKRRVRGQGGNLNHAINIGSAGDLSVIGIVDVSESRKKEKQELQVLNERLANYIERVRFFEAQNRKLASELDRLTVQVRVPSQLKNKYNVELEQARRLLEDAVEEKLHLTVTVEDLQVENKELRQRLEFASKDAAEAKEMLDRQNQQLRDLEAANGLLRRQVESLVAERDKERERNKKLQDGLNAARKDLNSETLLHIHADNKRQSLEEELLFLKALYEQELKELRVLICRDSTTENHEYWSTQMGLALREFQEAYDRNVEEIRLETETHYNIQLEIIQTNATKNHMQWAHFKEENVRLREQLQTMGEKLADAENKYSRLKIKFDQLTRERGGRDRELETENSELRNQVITLQATIDAMIKEIKIILDSKHGLELEIITYRRLLDTEENRSGLRETINVNVSSDGLRDSGYYGHSDVDDSLISSSKSNEYTIRQTESTSGDNSKVHAPTVKGEMLARTTSKKSAKGPIEIVEYSPDGKYIALKNTKAKEELLRNWRLTLSIDGRDVANHTFHSHFTLGPEKTIKIWARGTKPHSAGICDVESNKSFGIGDHITAKLINPEGEERATYIQMTTRGGDLLVGIINNGPVDL